MQHSAKYLIHAEIRTSGVVERSDVVGAIFGQTEGLLGDELELRGLQDSSKVGRINVDIESEGGRSYGSVTIASGLDRVETAVLAAALETMERVGPCKADCTITQIEDARAAKRRQVVDRATELLNEFEDEVLAGERLVSAVRKRARVAEITEYEGLPAGPRVAHSDAIILVEGRADVRQLLEHGIKNAIAVEGTDVPDTVARLTFERNTTAFLDGDRGGDLILRELEQVGEIDYVAFAPPHKSVEELTRDEILDALRKKVPYEQVEEGASAREVFAPDENAVENVAATTAETEQTVAETTTENETKSSVSEETVSTGDTPEAKLSADTSEANSSADDVDDESQADRQPQTLAGHVADVCGDERELVRLLDDEFEVIVDDDVTDAFETVLNTDPTPHTVVLDGTVDQRLLDVAAQRGVSQLVGTDTAELVKQPTSVRVRTTAEFELEV